MKSKYLREIDCEPDFFIRKDDERNEQFKKEIKEYGFASYETWNLDITFVEFLYIMFRMYDDYNCIDTHFHHFEVEDEDWDMQKGIDYIIETTKNYLITRKFFDSKLDDKLYDVLKKLMPLMWW